MNRFRQNAMSYLDAHRPSDEHDWDWMFLMRHHGAPSRLLDWTESPLIGLYFAVERPPPAMDDDAVERDGHVWVLLPTLLNERRRVRVLEDADSRVLPHDDVQRRLARPRQCV